MNRNSFVLSILLFLIASLLRAQGEAALPFLEINPNPQSIGLGWTGVSTPSNEPLGYYFNPAILGYSGRSNNLGFQTYTTKPDWLGIHILTFKTTAFTAGYNFNNVLKDLNISAAAGYSNFKVGYGTFIGSNNVSAFRGMGSASTSFESYDRYDAYSIGASVDYYVNLSFGFNYKKVESQLSESPAGQSNTIKAKLDALDWGLLLNIPVSKLAFSDYSLKINEYNELKPLIELSFGYSKSNIGKEVVYIDAAQSDPMPRMARLGYTLSFGADIKLREHSINLFTDDIIVEADDMLASIDTTTWKISYQGLLGDIKFGQNLLQWKASDKVTLRKANRLYLFETISILSGSFYGAGWDAGRYTSGLVFTSNGLFKILGWFIEDSPALQFLLSHLEIQYVKASTFNNTDIYSQLNSISVMFNRFTF
jgi:hypothetical protein